MPGKDNEKAVPFMKNYKQIIILFISIVCNIILVRTISFVVDFHERKAANL